eukprot:457588_1
MAAMLQVEGNNGTSEERTEEIKIWMEQHKLSLSNDSYKKLKVNGFEKINDFQHYQSANELYNGATDMDLIIKDAQILKRAFDNFDFITTIDNANQDHHTDKQTSFVNTVEQKCDEIKIDEESIINALSFNEKNSMYRWYTINQNEEEIIKISKDEQYLLFANKQKTKIQITKDIKHNVSIKPTITNNNDIIKHIMKMKSFINIADQQSFNYAQYLLNNERKSTIKNKKYVEENRIVRIKISSIEKTFPAIFVQTISKLNRKEDNPPKISDQQIEILLSDIKKKIYADLNIGHDINSLYKNEYKVDIKTDDYVGTAIVKFGPDIIHDDHIYVGCSTKIIQYSISDNPDHIKKKIHHMISCELSKGIQQKIQQQIN